MVTRLYPWVVTCGTRYSNGETAWTGRVDYQLTYV